MARILTVEDDADLQYLYELILTRHGHEVFAVDQTSDAIVTLTNELFDLIILDINMPDMPGTKLLEFVRDDARLKHIPVVVISANQQYMAEVRALGVDHFFVKPVAMKVLVEVVEHVLVGDQP